MRCPYSSSRSICMTSLDQTLNATKFKHTDLKHSKMYSTQVRSIQTPLSILINHRYSYNVDSQKKRKTSLFDLQKSHDLLLKLMITWQIHCSFGEAAEMKAQPLKFLRYQLIVVEINTSVVIILSIDSSANLSSPLSTNQL